MSFWKSLSAKLGRHLILYGGWGLFGISFLDSTFIPFPLVNDLLLMHLSVKSPAATPFYVVGCTAGSVLGAYVLYALGAGGGKFFRRFSEEKVGGAERWLARNDFVAVLVISLLPAPAPFKVFLVSAGALRINRLRYGTALVIGRGARFAAEGWLAAHYGARAEAFLKANLVWVSVVTALVVIAATVVSRSLARRPAST